MKKIVLYGAGKRGTRYAQMLQERNIDVLCFIDKDETKWGHKVEGIEIKGINNLEVSDDILIYITVVKADGVKEYLMEHGVKEEFIKDAFDIVLKNYLHDVSSFYNEDLKIQDEKTVFFDCINGFVLGGVEKWCLDVGCNLIDDGYPVKYIAKRLDVLPPISNRQNVEYIRIHNCCEFENHAIKDIFNVIMNNLPCTVFACMPDEVLLAASMAKKIAGEHVKIISVIHNDIDDYYKKNSKFNEYVDIYLCVSETIQRKMQEAIGTNDNIIKKICPVAYDKNLERGYSLAGEPIKIGYAGRIVTLQKRMHLLIPLLKKMDDENINFEMCVAGEGAYLEQLKCDAYNYEIENKVHILGRLSAEEMPDFWKRQDVCINIADHEGRSLSIMEAMGNGAVPIVTNTSGNEDIVNGKNGYVVDIDAIDAMIPIINYLDENRDKLMYMGKNAHEQIVKECDKDQYMEYIKSIV